MFLEMADPTYTDLYYLATAPEPTRDEDRGLTLVYRPAGGGERRYRVSLLDAWAYEGSPYELLSGRFEDFDGDGSCYFVEGDSSDPVEE